MERIPLLKEAAASIGSDSILAELSNLESRINSSNVPIMIPLVGEFSSGKTSLINALTDSKALETATKPTTATIFEIHFGAPKNRAEVMRNDGQIEVIDEIANLKNDLLADTTVVTVFDTSKKVSPYTILVDTPGISSPNPKHQQVLMDFLPQADALLLVIDINQQLTKSLSNFLKSASLSGIEINVVLTKSDTKSLAEIEAARSYFIGNCEFELNKLVCVSAAKGNLTEILDLLKDIERRKNDIVCKSVSKRLNTLSEQILTNIDILLNASFDSTSLESEISSQKLRLHKIERKIDQMVEDINGDLDDLTRSSFRKFEDQVSSRLNSLINGKCQNYDAEAVSAINTIASAIIGDYRAKVMRILTDKAQNNSKEDGSIASLTGIDLSGIGIQGLSYDLNLNSIGHEYDKWIKGGVIAIGAAAAVGAVVATGGAAAAAEGALTVGTVVDVADTVTDVGSVMSNRKLVSRMESAVKYGTKAVEKYATIDNINNTGYGESGVGKGMIDSLVGFISEKTMSKPQRARAIRIYIDSNLAPEFKTQLQNAASNIIGTVKDTLVAGAQNSVTEITTQLKKLEEEMRNNRSTAETRKSELRELQTKILTI
jgi:elongation factor Tu GTP binding domain